MEDGKGRLIIGEFVWQFVDGIVAGQLWSVWLWSMTGKWGQSPLEWGRIVDIRWLTHDIHTSLQIESVLRDFNLFINKFDIHSIILQSLHVIKNYIFLVLKMKRSWKKSSMPFYFPTRLSKGAQIVPGLNLCVPRFLWYRVPLLFGIFCRRTYCREFQAVCLVTRNYFVG